MKTFFKKEKEQRGTKGFIVLFTVLIASVVLAMALGMSSIALKQIVLTASATDANKSFYAADSGIECAIYHDVKASPTAFNPGGPGSSITCGNVVNLIPTQNGFGVFTFSIDWSSPDGDACSEVTVDKSLSNQTVVTSKGTNFICGEVGQRTVERVIEVTY